MNGNKPSKLGLAYKSIYDAICGRHPHLRPWHFQWLDAFYLYKKLKEELPKHRGVIVDVGCGEKPYKDWFGSIDRYIGVDVFDGPGVDIVDDNETDWGIDDESADVVLSTQVLEHVENPEHTLSQIRRVLQRGGYAIISVPFIYNEHGAPYDFRRFSANQAAKLFPDWEVISVERQGGIGSTLSILLLNWIEMALNQFFPTRILKALLLPLWLLFSLLVNVLGVIWDKLDITDSFYNNVFFVVRKPESEKKTGSPAQS